MASVRERFQAPEFGSRPGHLDHDPFGPDVSDHTADAGEVNRVHGTWRGVCCPIGGRIAVTSIASALIPRSSSACRVDTGAKSQAARSASSLGRIFAASSSPVRWPAADSSCRCFQSLLSAWLGGASGCRSRRRRCAGVLDRAAKS